MNPILHAGMRLGPAGRRWVAILGWVFVALPCLGMAALSGFFWAWESGRAKGTVPAAGTVVSFRVAVHRDGNSTRWDYTTHYRYAVDGTTYDGQDKSWRQLYQNEGSRRSEEERAAWQPEETRRDTRKNGDPVTVYYHRGAPWKSSLEAPLQPLVVGDQALWAVSSGAAGLLLTVLGWLYLRDPVEIRVAVPARADALVGAAFGATPPPADAASDEAGISSDVAQIRRREGTTAIAFGREGGPAFRAAGLFPPVLLLVILVWVIVLRGLDPATPRGAAAHFAVAAVVAFIAAPLGYSRRRRSLRIRNGVLEIESAGLLGKRTRRLARAQVDRLEPRWTLSEVSRFGEAAWFDLDAVRGDGRRLVLAEGLPRVEVADSLARLVARELGLAPEQALTCAAARARDLAIARGGLAAPASGRRGLP